MTRIAIITANENIWSLGNWSRAVPALQQSGLEVAGLWAVAPATGKNSNSGYIAAFGRWNFFKFGFFGVAVRLCQLLGGRPMTLRRLASRANIFYAEADTANDAALVDWVKAQGIDILLVQVPHIIQKPLMAAVTTGIINHHAALLPANRGIYPYFWAVTKCGPQGVSFHLVTEKVDGGPLLYQEMVMEPEELSSMTVFEVEALRHYPARLRDALANLERKMFQPPAGVTESYHGFPARADYLQFRAQHGHIIRLRDIIVQAVRLVF